MIIFIPDEWVGNVCVYPIDPSFSFDKDDGVVGDVFKAGESEGIVVCLVDELEPQHIGALSPGIYAENHQVNH